jgi:DNA polymerase I-like protein with 3'-5' exonuclease and polymerase domains
VSLAQRHGEVTIVTLRDRLNSLGLLDPGDESQTWLGSVFGTLSSRGVLVAAPGRTVTYQVPGRNNHKKNAPVWVLGSAGVSLADPDPPPVPAPTLQIVTKTFVPRTWTGVQDAKYTLIQTMDQFNRVYPLMKEQRMLAVDTETTGLDWVRNRACGIVIGWGIENNYYFPIRHQTTEPQLSMEDIREPLQQVLGNPDSQKIFWNEVFDRHFLLKEGIHVRGACFDGVVLVHLMDENDDKGLKEVSCRYIDPQCDKWEKVIDAWRGEEARKRRTAFSALMKDTLTSKRGELELELRNVESSSASLAHLIRSPAETNRMLKELVKEKLKDHPWAGVKKSEITYDQVPLDIITPYACADVHYTWMMFKSLYAKVYSHDSLKKLLLNEIQLSSVLFEVEEHGVKIDIPFLQSLEPKFVNEIADLAKEIHVSVGYEFNVDSNEALIKALKTAGCQLMKLTKKGQDSARAGKDILDKEYSVDKEVLEQLATQYEFAAKVQLYREKQKLLNTYVRNIIEVVDDRRHLHSTFNANVSTGRMSSREPNIQNIPGKNLDIRRAFTVPEEIGAEGAGSKDYVFVFADYSQVELRLTAHWSEDQTLLAAYSPTAPGWIGKEQDVHAITCADVVLGRPLQEVLTILGDDKHPEYKDVKWRRNIAKRVNFGIIYGAGPGAIQRQVSTPKKPVTKDECSAYIDKYFQRYRGVHTWIRKTEMAMREYGQLLNTFGRYRRLPNSRSAQKWERERAARQGVNFLIQGDAADVFKHAVVRVRNFLRSKNARTKIVNFVHDEIQFYWHKDEFALLKPVKKLMENFPDYRVPIIVEFAWSERDWASKRELKVH